MYFIYHIPGVKIGCSINPKRRVRAQKYKEFEILEEHINKNYASIREIELQKQYGYQIDNIKYERINYTQIGKIGGSKNTKKQKKSRSKVGKEYGKIFGIQNVINGTLKKAGDISRANGSLEKARNAIIKKYSIPIIAIELKTNKETEFSSVREGCRELGLAQSNVQQILKQNRKTIKGYTFKYKNK